MLGRRVAANFGHLEPPWSTRSLAVRTVRIGTAVAEVVGVAGLDWSLVGGDPAPGDPAGVRHIATQLRDLADEVAVQNRVLRSVGSDSESVWVGPAANAFAPHLQKLPGQLEMLVRSYGDAADALDGYWPALRDAKELAQVALARAQVADADIAVARTQVAAAEQAVAGAAAALAAAEAAAAAAAAAGNPGGGAGVGAAITAYQAARAQLARALAQLAAAHARFDAALALAGQARTDAKVAARRVAAGLEQASAQGIQNPHRSWWSTVADDLGHVAGDTASWVEHTAVDTASWAEHHWSELALAVPGLDVVALANWAWHQIPVKYLKDASAVLGIVATVAGLLSLVPIIGECFIPIAVTASLLQTADDLELAANHDGSWGAVGLDLAGDTGLVLGDGFVKLAEATEEFAAATSDVVRAERNVALAERVAADAEGRIPQLTRDAQALRQQANTALDTTSAAAGGETLTQRADAAEKELAVTKTKLAEARSTIAENQKILDTPPPQLPNKVRIVAGMGDQGLAARFGRAVRSPTAFVSDVLHGDAAEELQRDIPAALHDATPAALHDATPAALHDATPAVLHDATPGELATSDATADLGQRIQSKWQSLWGGAGKVYFRTGLISGAVGTASGTAGLVTAYGDAFRSHR